MFYSHATDDNYVSTPAFDLDDIDLEYYGAVYEEEVEEEEEDDELLFELDLED
jgi:hypothetical protein